MTEFPIDDYITSVRFSPSGDLAAVGSANGLIKIFNLEKSLTNEQLCILQEDLSILHWKSETCIVTGNSLGTIRFWDIRSPSVPSRILKGFHKDKVCGMARSPDGSLIASGCNGAVINIWDDRKLEKPFRTLSTHVSAVRALAFCPWQPSILASGGGFDDEYIHFHNVDSGMLTLTLIFREAFALGEYW
jgi:cell division cycle protein 20 (cofactor of APC complex)